MKTTTIRVDDDLLLLIQRIGKDTRRGTADVIRDALRACVSDHARRDTGFAKYANDVAKRKHAAAVAEVYDGLGLPLEDPDVAASASR
jgi:predicted transcriptional regulator